jgi:hypothetical protein
VITAPIQDINQAGPPFRSSASFFGSVVIAGTLVRNQKIIQRPPSAQLAPITETLQCTTNKARIYHSFFTVDNLSVDVVDILCATGALFSKVNARNSIRNGKYPDTSKIVSVSTFILPLKFVLELVTLTDNLHLLFSTLLIIVKVKFQTKLYCFTSLISTVFL